MAMSSMPLASLPLGSAALSSGGGVVLPPLPLNSAIVYLGDSLTSADTLYSFRLLTGVLSQGRYFPGPLGNQGVAGNRTDEMLARISATTNQSPKVTVVLAGINDIIQGRTDAQIIAGLTSIYAALRASGSRIVALTIAKTFGVSALNGTQEAYRQAVNAWIAGRAAADLKVVSLESIITAEAQTYDGLHWFPSGSFAVAAAVAVALNDWTVSDTFFTAGNPAGNAVALSKHQLAGTNGGGWMKTGQVAAGFDLANSDVGGGVPAVPNLVGSKSTLNGALQWQHIALSGTAAGNASVSFAEWGTTVNVLTGDVLEAFMEIELAPNPVGLNGFDFSWGGSSAFSASTPSNGDPLWGNQTIRGIIRTTPFVRVSDASLGSFSAQFRMGVVSGAALAVGFKIGRFGYRKIV